MKYPVFNNKSLFYQASRLQSAARFVFRTNESFVLF